MFLVDGIEYESAGKLRAKVGIKVIGRNYDLEEFVMSVMKFDRKISKKLFSIFWMYVDGEDIEFPVTLIRL